VVQVHRGESDYRLGKTHNGQFPLLQAGTHLGRLHRPGQRRLHLSPEILRLAANELDHLPRIHPPGHHDHHVLGMISPGVVVLECVPIQLYEHFLVADNGIPHGAVPIGRVHVELPELALGIVLSHLDLLLDDGLFPGHFLGIQGAFGNVGEEQVQGILPMLGGGIDVITAAIVGGEGVALPANGLHSLFGLGFREGSGRPSRKHMLEVVGDPRSLVLPFVDEPRLHKNLGGHHIVLGLPMNQHGQPVLEDHKNIIGPGC